MISNITINNKTPNFSFKVTVQGDVYDFRLMWNVRSNKWMLSIGDVDGWIFENLSLVAGIDYFNFVGLERMPSNASLFVVSTPDYDTLGEEVQLVLVEG